jgi:hypothetical protein
MHRFEQYLKILQLYHENSRFPPSFKFWSVSTIEKHWDEPPFWICKWANHLSFLAMNNPLPVWFYHQFLYLYIVTTLVVQQYIDFYLYFHYFDLWIQAEFYLRNIRYGFDLVFIVYVFMVHKWHQTKKVFLIIPV